MERLRTSGIRGKGRTKGARLKFCSPHGPSGPYDECHDESFGVFDELLPDLDQTIVSTFRFSSIFPNPVLDHNKPSLLNTLARSPIQHPYSTNIGGELGSHPSY